MVASQTTIKLLNEMHDRIAALSDHAAEFAGGDCDLDEQIAEIMAELKARAG